MSNVATIQNPGLAAARKTRRALTLLLFAGSFVVAPLFASSLTPPAMPEPVAEPLEIQAVELFEEAPGMQLEVSTSGELVWTSYRDAHGNLIVELPNSVPRETLADLSLTQGLVESAHLRVRDEFDEPLTQLVVRTSAEAEHYVAADGDRLVVDLTPVVDRPIASDPKVEEAELIAAARLDLPTVGAPTASAASSSTGFDTAPGLGTVDSPYRSDLPNEGGAGHMYGVDVSSGDSSTVVRVAGDGEFYYSTFALQNPNRFVLDLNGVVNSASVAQVPVEDGRVQRVRLAQFKPQPDLVARVVIDLSEPLAPVIQSTADGLELTFSGEGVPAAGEEVLDSASLVAENEDDSWTDETWEDVPSVDESEVVESWDEAPAAAEAPADDWTEASAAADAANEAWNEVREEAETADEAWDESAAEAEAVAESWDEASAETEAADEAWDEAWEEAPAAAEADDSWSEPMAAEAESIAEQAVDTAAAPAVEAAAAPVMPEPMPESDSWQEPAEQAEEVAWEEATEDWADEPVTEEQLAAVMPEPEPWQENEPASQEISMSKESAETGPSAVAAPAPPAVAPQAFAARSINDPEPTYDGEPITMSLKEADIKDVLRSFAQLSGLNIVVQPGVSGTVTVELKEVPWDQALEQVLKINSLDYDLEGNIMRIAPISQLRAEAEEQQRLRAAQALSIPLRTIVRRVSYAQAQQIATVLRSGGGASIMSQRGSVVVDKRTNTLILKELPNFIDSVIAIIEQLDIPEPQVMIEARIIETTKRFSRTLGIEWDINGIASAATGNTTGLQFPNNGEIQGGVQLLTGAQNGFLDISLGNVLNTFTLDAVLQAAETEGLINILSAPKITTLNNEKATIQSGLQIPIQTIANNTVSVQFVNATLRLDVTPHVTAEGTVLMDVNIQKREPQLAFAVVGASNAPISTKDAKTRVIVRDGGTTVIGGIYQVSSDQGEDRVPGLSSIPILGHLFKNKRRDDENEELLIFITPRVVKL